MLSELGLSVTRTIPVELFPGLVSGAYSLHGGVVRDGAGKIVAHLISSAGSSLTSLIPGADLLSSVVSNGQLYMLAKDVKGLQSAVSSALSAATAGAVLSGMGLVVSIAGFSYLSQRIERVEKLVVEVKDLIEIRYVADLKAAIGYMKGADEANVGPENRRSLLLEAQRNFSTLSHLYGDLFEKAVEIKQVKALESFYTLAFTGASIVNSELGMGDIATRQFVEHQDHWKSIVRPYIDKHVIAGRPENLLAISPDLLPTTELIDILDFSTDSNKGYLWLDELRKPSNKNIFGTGWRLSNPFPRSPTINGDILDFAKASIRKSQVLDSQSAHLEFLSQKGLSVGEFSGQLKIELNKMGSEALCVLNRA